MKKIGERGTNLIIVFKMTVSTVNVVVLEINHVIRSGRFWWGCLLLLSLMRQCFHHSGPILCVKIEISRVFHSSNISIAKRSRQSSSIRKQAKTSKCFFCIEVVAMNRNAEEQN